VIIATGSSAKWLGLPSEEKLRGRGISSCATCDGYFFRGKRVVVVGGGDTAIEEALFLTKFATQVVVVHRRDSLRASKIMQKRAMTNDKIKFIWNSVIEDVLGHDKVESVKLRNLKTGEVSIMPSDGVFVAIGFQPNTSLFEGQIELDEKGYVISKQGTKTSVEGVFVAGDVHDHKYRQAVTAAGEGCKAAMDALAYLEEQKEITVSAKE
jgi:thioredoxin reductase (NADPH)